MVQRFNDSEYAKRDMSALWMEILDSINPVIHDYPTNNDRVRMALYSGHDSTLAPLMASLGQHMWNDTDFPSYASMMIIEVSVYQYKYRTIFKLAHHIRSILSSKPPLFILFS